MVNIFKDSTTSIPKSDGQIVRVDFTEMQLMARKSHMPKATPNQLTINHTPNKG